MSAEDSLAKEVAIRIAGEIVLAKNPGEVMKRWRERFNVSQVQLAKYMGVTPSVVSDYEGGRRKSPGAHLIRRYVEALIAIDKERGSPVISELSRFIAVSD
ncbi:MAG: transcriptional regulator, partial [Thermoprotei archaeon]